ncbi:MAG: hypothetical protein HY720_22980 [Planctomycetes bacterium]|nr:hypothetical protein [Planctomycetota bacterium]
MPLKATKLYGKIVAGRGWASREEIEEVEALEDEMLEAGKWVPAGELYLGRGILDGPRHEEVLRRHQATNRIKNDAVFGEYLVQSGVLDEGVEEIVRQKGTRSLEPIEETGPLLESVFIREAWLDETTHDAIDSMNQAIRARMTRMTGYPERLVEPQDEDATWGRLAFQLRSVTRHPLFVALYYHANLPQPRSFQAVLEELGLLDGPSGEAARAVHARYRPG